MLSILKRIFVRTPFIIFILAGISFLGWVAYKFYIFMMMIFDYNGIPHFIFWVIIGFIAWLIAAIALKDEWDDL
ncbi:hypothetical protein [Paenibacillus polymyxa]|uniref:hypothetical protein n=1 Tax=Paenibacillus polymyxa TaxID=1406 RepID=UPI0025B6C156|nr:hypothetical protein [Paenibacillus polymyxa]MDN4090906.1 hypothetical protein [Paenibacillus polymyxa]